MTTKDAADRPQIGGRLRRVLDFLVSFTDEHGYPPTMRETAAAAGLTSTSSVAHHLGVLEGRGYIARTAGTPRGITILTPTNMPLIPSGGPVGQHCPTCTCGGDR